MQSDYKDLRAPVAQVEHRVAYLCYGAGRELVERRLRARAGAGEALHGLRELRLLLHQLAHRIAQQQRLKHIDARREECARSSARRYCCCRCTEE